MIQEMLLVFLKPDAVIRRYVGAQVTRELLDTGLTVERFGEPRPSREFLARSHYAPHKGKFFYDWLISYVSSGPLMAFILSGESAVSKVRSLLGATNPKDAELNSIRGRYGIPGGINVAHASDSAKNGRLEVELWTKMLTGWNRNDVSPRKDAARYGDRYIDFPMLDSERYRELTRWLARGDLVKDKGLRCFQQLLAKESDLDGESVAALARVMVENALLRRENEVKE